MSGSVMTGMEVISFKSAINPVDVNSRDIA